MTRNELMIQTLNETLSKVVSENLNLVVTVKELQILLGDTRKESENMAQAFKVYQTDTEERILKLQELVVEKTKGE
jgi:hypothetical protein